MLTGGEGATAPLMRRGGGVSVAVALRELSWVRASGEVCRWVRRRRGSAVLRWVFKSFLGREIGLVEFGLREEDLLPCTRTTSGESAV